MNSNQCTCYLYGPTWIDPAGATPCAYCEEQEWRARTGLDEIERQQDIDAEAQPVTLTEVLNAQRVRDEMNQSAIAPETKRQK